MCEYVCEYVYVNSWIINGLLKYIKVGKNRDCHWYTPYIITGLK